MPHIHTNLGEHDFTTTAFIVRIDDSGTRAFLHRHRKLGLLLPVGGHIELKETPWAAVLHEITEESGYDATQLQVLQPRERVLKMDGVKTHPVPLFLQTHEFKTDTGHYHSDIGFVFVTDQMPNGAPADGESDEIIWLDAEGLRLRADEMPPDILQIYEFCLTTAFPRWDRVSLREFDA